MSRYVLNNIITQYDGNKMNRSSNDLQFNCISKFNEFLSDPQNQTPEIEQMINEYTNYLTQRQHSINNNNNAIKNNTYKQVFFTNLEKLLSEIIYIKNINLRKERINSIYKWFTKTIQSHRDLSQIRNQTNPALDQKLTVDELNINNKEYQINQERQYKLKHGDPSLHRTHIYNYAKPSDILNNDYLCKHIRQKKINSNHQNITNPNDESNSSLHHQSQVIPRVKINQHKDKEMFRSSMGMRSTFYSTSRTSINDTFNKEIKSSYSYNRPEYNYQMLNVEQNVNGLKNKYLSEKRNQEEIKRYVNEYGAKRGLFKSNLQRKFEIKHIINLYTKKLKDDKEINKHNDENEDNNNTNNNKSSNIIVKKIVQIRRRIGANKSFSSVNLNMLSDKNKNMFIQRSSIKHNTTKSDNHNTNNNNNKVIVNNIKNIDDNNIISHNELNEQIYTYKVTINSNENKTQIMNYKLSKDDNDNLQVSDHLISNALINNNNDHSILHARLISAQMNSLKTNGKSKQTYHINQLSGYSVDNYKSFYNPRMIYENRRRDYQCSDVSDCSIGSFVKMNFDYDNYLKTRKSIANYKENEVKNIKASLSFRERKRNKLKRDILEEGMESYYKNKNNDVKKQTHIRMKVNSLENAFMMNESNIIYPKLFLPRDNSGLLNIPTDMLSSKKKTKGTKSKSKR